tara:strand:- start:462 stop:698 length:237 start_codon:yes stop_codon:yes gene_type:complete
MKISKQQKTMKSILKIKTQSFLDNYKKNLFQDILKKPELDVVNESDKQVKQWIKEGTLTDDLLVGAIKNVMKERIKHG